MDIPKIRVAIRKRPLSRKEVQNKDIDIIEAIEPNSIIVRELKYLVESGPRST